MYWRSGRSAGKSKNLPYSMIAKAIQDNMSILVLRNTLESIKETTYNQMLECLEDMHVPYKATMNPMKIELLCNRDNNPMINFKGMDKPSKLKSWKTIPDTRIVWFEEATEITDWHAVNKVKLSIRKGERYFIFSYNPEIGEHWLQKVENELDPETAELVIPSPIDNPYNDKTFWDEMEIIRRVDERLWDHYVNGAWMDLGGKVYSIDEKNILDEPDPDYMQINIGIDLGSVDPTTFVACGITDKFEEVHILENYVDDNEGKVKDWNETMRDFKEFYHMVIDKYSPRYTPNVYVENAAQGNKFVSLLINNGIYQAREVKKSPIDQRILYWNYMLSSGVMKINPELEIYNELKNITYDAKSKRMDKNDHSINAGEYALETEINYLGWSLDE